MSSSKVHEWLSRVFQPRRFEDSRDSTPPNTEQLQAETRSSSKTTSKGAPPLPPPPYSSTKASLDSEVSDQAPGHLNATTNSPGKKPTPFNPDESRKRIDHELGRLSMNPRSTAQWAKANPLRNGDRMRNFIYHCLLWQYQVRLTGQQRRRQQQPALSQEDRRHFILLCRFITEWLHYDHYEKKAFPPGDRLMARVRECLDFNWTQPLQTVGMDRTHVFCTMSAWVQEFGREISGPALPFRGGLPGWSLEAAATAGKWEEVGNRIAYDLTLVDIVTPYGDDLARDALVNAINERRRLYLERASR